MSEWIECTLGDIIIFQRGHDLTQTNFINGPFPVAGSNGIIDYHNAYTTEGPGITLGRSGNSVGVAHYYETNFWAHNTTLYSKKFKNSFPKFVYYLLKAIKFRRFSGGSAVPTLNRNHIHPIELSVPPLPEQKAIADVLSSLDNKIDLLHRQNETLEAMAQTLFRQWFVEEAKDDWEVITIGDYTEINKASISKDYPHKTVEYLDTGSITDGNIDSFQLFSLEEAPSRARRLVEHNDVIISTVRPNQRHYGIIKNPKENTVVSTGFCVITCPKIAPHFIYILLTLPDMTEYLHVIAEASTSAYPSLKPSDIAGIEFQMPPKKQLEKFSELTNSFWEKIDKNADQIHTLEKLRDTLLPKLMSGKVRVQI